MLNSKYVGGKRKKCFKFYRSPLTETFIPGLIEDLSNSCNFPKQSTSVLFIISLALKTMPKDQSERKKPIIILSQRAIYLKSSPLATQRPSKTLKL